VAGAGGKVTYNWKFTYKGSKKVDGKCKPDPTATTGQVKATPELLPEGAMFATATVSPDTTIEVQQPGYAIIVTAEVLGKKRVNLGDKLNAGSTSSIGFDDGTGVVVEKPKNGDTGKLLAIGGGIAATIGSVALLDRGHPQALPIQNGSATMYVAADQPFSTPA